jgi:stringent starvation protein B
VACGPAGFAAPGWCLAPSDAMEGSMPTLPRKKAVALELLERTSVFIHLDPRRPGVIVPQNFLKQPQLVLQIGLNMAIPIVDLDVGDEGISCTLSFNKRPCFCYLPWDAIYALIGEGGGGMVWPEDVPPEVVNQHRASASKVPAPKKDARVSRPALRAVDADSADRNAREEMPRAPLAARDADVVRPTVVRRAASRPPRLVPVPGVDPDSDSSAATAKANEPETQKPEAPLSSSRQQAGASESGSKRTRPPYLRLVT